MILVSPAGKLRHRVTLMQRYATVTNELGESQPTDITLSQVWAWVRPLSAKEILANAENVQSITHAVRMRYTTAITHADWISYNGRRLEIVQIIDAGEEDRETVIVCNEQQH